ncbi:hypothetical protein AB0M54_24575 [Actinoplanes sp. NPDC051470]|uniref:hypothetical protein n=1 Tax=Actinoplanes sp. NPDC051470 TaxID=3157224 RepID=UPI00341F7622
MSEATSAALGGLRGGRRGSADFTLPATPRPPEFAIGTSRRAFAYALNESLDRRSR